MPHLHLSLQAGSDLILKRMKRRHLRADAHGGDRARPRAAARHRVRRRPDRRLPDRDRRAVPRDAGFRAARRRCRSCTCSPTASAPARRPRACPRCRSRSRTRARGAAARSRRAHRGARSCAAQVGRDRLAADRDRPIRAIPNISPRCGWPQPPHPARLLRARVDRRRRTTRCWRRPPDGARRFFSRLKEGLSRSTQKLTERHHRGLHEAPAGRRGAGGTGRPADLGRSRHRGRAHG